MILRYLLLTVFYSWQGLLSSQSHTITITGEIDEQLILSGELTYQGTSIAAECISINLNSAGTDSLGQKLLFITAVEAGGMDFEIDPNEDFAVLPGKDPIRELKVEFEVDLKMVSDWRGQVGYVLFPFTSADQGWYPDIYLNGTRYFNKDFKVSLVHPDEWVFLTSGKLNQQEKVNSNKLRSDFSGKDLHYFGLNAGKGYSLDTKRVGEIQISCLYPETEAVLYQNVLRYAEQAISWYIETYGFFPKSHLGISMGNNNWGGGFPSENVFYIHRGRTDEEFLRWITAHEVGHYYWGHHVLAAQSGLDWLMLGNGIWIDHLYLSDQYDVPLEEVWHTTALFTGMMRRYLTATLLNVNQELGLAPEDYQKENFNYNGLIAHGKAALGIQLLSREMGYTDFLEVQRRIVENYGNRKLTVNDFIKYCEEKWTPARNFIKQWSQPDALIEYIAELKEIEEVGENWRFTIDLIRRGTVDYPMELAVKDSLGNTQLIKSVGKEGRETLTGEMPGKPQVIDIDPNGAVPMWNSSHAAIERNYILALYYAGHRQAAEKLGLIFLAEHPADRWIKEILDRDL